MPISNINETLSLHKSASGGTTNFLPFLAGITAISGAFSQIQAGRARKATAEANEFIADLRAKSAKKRGRINVSKSRQQYKKLLGKQRAAMAAQGISLADGSAQDIQQETQDVSELDALTIKLNAGREAFGFEAAGRGFKAAGSQAERIGRIGATQSLLTGGLRYLDRRN